MNFESYVSLMTKTSFPLCFLLLVILVELLVARSHQKTFNFSYVFANFGTLFVGVTIFSLVNKYLINKDFIISLGTKHSLFSFENSWTVFLVWFIIFDFINYWTHRWYHFSSFLWMFHAVHHTDKMLSSSTTVRVPITASFFVVTSYTFLSLFGGNVAMLTTIAQTMFLQQIIVHSFLLRGVIPARVSNYLVTPDSHANHHAKKYGNTNYGFFFSLWDRMFGTFQRETDEDREFGVDSYTHSNNPFTIHWSPVISFFKNKKTNS